MSDCNMKNPNLASVISPFVACLSSILSLGNYSTPCLKKGPTCKFSVTLSNLNRFSNFLHCWKAHKIRYKTKFTKLPTSP